MGIVEDTLASATALYESFMSEAPDTCTVYNRTYSGDGTGGTTKADGVVATGIPIVYEEFRFNSGMVAGGALANVTHKIFLKDTAVNRAIKPNYVIVVPARGNNLARTFENPIALDETMGVGVV